MFTIIYVRTLSHLLCSLIKVHIFLYSQNSSFPFSNWNADSLNAWTMGNDIIVPQTTEKQDRLSEDYNNWRKKIISLIEQSKLKAILSVNAELLALYWKIGNDILIKQKENGWGTKVIVQLSKDLSEQFPDDRGYSKRNLRNMKRFASEYTALPIWQVPLAKLEQLPIRKAALAGLPCDGNGVVQVFFAQISWYHHMSLIAKVPTDAERAFYIMETATNGWSRDVMLSQVANGYIRAKGNAITNFRNTLPAYQSDLAQYTFKDPYNFRFPGNSGFTTRTRYRKFAWLLSGLLLIYLSSAPPSSPLARTVSVILLMSRYIFSLSS